MTINTNTTLAVQRTISSMEMSPNLNPASTAGHHLQQIVSDLGGNDYLVYQLDAGQLALYIQLLLMRQLFTGHAS